MVLQNKIPSIYHSIFPELLDIEFPQEQIATCETCNLCRSAQSPYINTKCCTYHPHLSNFLVGGILNDKDESLAIGKDRILAQIKARAGVTPYGIIPSVPYTDRQKKADGIDFWARSKDLMELQLCPYFDRGNCTIWKYRENLCVTHFCSSTGGASGKAFWKKVNKYLKMAETSLSQYAMLQLGWPPAKIITEEITNSILKLEDEHGKVDDTKYASLWGDWAGREDKFYKSCNEVIRNLDAPSFQRITGVTREILEAAIRDTQKTFLQNILPEKLILHPDMISEKGKEGFTRLVLGTASVEIPTVLFPLFRGFNGNRTTAEVFHLGYNLLLNMSELVDELCEKGILIKA